MNYKVKANENSSFSVLNKYTGKVIVANLTLCQANKVQKELEWLAKIINTFGEDYE